MAPLTTRSLAWLWPVAFMAGCALLASDDAPDDDLPDVATCDAVEPARSPLRRLTASELQHTLEDLLPLDDPGVLGTLPPEKVGGFSNNAEVRTVDTPTVEGYAALAERVADQLADDPEPLMGCDPRDEGESCVAGWLPGFLDEAFRRPQPAERADALLDLWRQGEAEWGARDATSVMLQVVLQSPELIYRVEPSALAAEPGTVVDLDGYEVASRLSYFLWSTAPDPILLAAAEAGELDTAEGVATHARRMLDDPRSERMVHRFFSEWMELEHLDEVEKDAALFPLFDEGIRARFHDEVHAFVGEVWHEEDASFQVLLTAPWTMADAELAAYYRLPEPEEDGFVRVERHPDFNAGFLTQGAFLASRARSYETSPVHRGMFVRGALLCESMEPPIGLDITPPDPDPELTTRERLAIHREDRTCAGCHDMLDPPGFAMEHFDAVGRFRSRENGKPIDATGELVATDNNGPFDGANELAWLLADSQDVQRCFSRQWFRYAHGRTDDKDGDACAVDETTGTFVSAGLDMRELVIATAASRAFRSAVGIGEGA